MDSKLFLSVLTNTFIRKLIFENVAIIHIKHLGVKSYKWNKLKVNHNQLALYRYNEAFKKSYGPMTNIATLSHTARIIIRTDNVDLIQFIIKTLYFKPEFLHYEDATSLGHFEVLKAMHELAPLQHNRYGELLSHVNLKLNFDLIVWLSDRFDEYNNSINKNNNSEITTDTTKKSKGFFSFFSRSSSTNNSQQKQQQPQQPPQENDKDTQIYVNFVYRKAMSNAAKLGRFDLVKWFAERGKVTFTKFETDMIKCVINGGNIEILEWLFNEKNVQISDSYNFSTIDEAVSHHNSESSCGYFEMLKYLHEHQLGHATISTMNTVASNGDLEVMKWLHVNRTEGCTTEAMNNAAMNNHYPMIEWLHLNRTEGCTSNAMALACRHSLSLVQWFHVNRTEGCSFIGMAEAVANNLEMVKWLNENYGDRIAPMTGVLSQTITHNHIDIFQYLYEKRIQEFQTFQTYYIVHHIKECIENHREEMLKLILDVSFWKPKIKKEMDEIMDIAKEWNSDSSIIDILNQIKADDSIIVAVD